MPLDKKTVVRISRLARIAVPDDEHDRLAGELSAILDWVRQLDEVKTGDVEPMTGGTAMALKSRADGVTDGGRAVEVTGNAPDTADGFFVVPKVVE